MEKIPGILSQVVITFHLGLKSGDLTQSVKGSQKLNLRTTLVSSVVSRSFSLVSSVVSRSFPLVSSVVSRSFPLV